MSETAGIGHNNPPPTELEAFIARLEEKNEKLLDQIAALELSRRHVPKEVKSDEDVAKVNAHVLQARGLLRLIEDLRVSTKAPYLERGRTIDTWFGGLSSPLAGMATTLERRNSAYLAAKRVAEKARAEAAAAKAREEARLAAEAAEAARAAARKADEERAAAEEALRAEEMARQPSNVVPLRRTEETPSETALREASAESMAASAAAQEALDAANKAQRDAERADARTETPTLGRAVAGGGSARLVTIWVPTIVDQKALVAALGVLGPFFTEPALAQALARASKTKPQPPPIPGVEWISEDEARVRASRRKEQTDNA